MQEGVWGHRPVLEGGREGGGGGGGGSGHSHSQPKILTLSHILPPFGYPIVAPAYLILSCGKVQRTFRASLGENQTRTAAIIQITCSFSRGACVVHACIVFDIGLHGASTRNGLM